jgi:Domain of unknown function (DUF4333)
VYPCRRGLAFFGPVLLVVVAALGACGGTSTPKSLNLDAGRQKLAEVYGQKYGSTTTVGLVRCPGPVEMKQGVNFFCTIDLGGVPLRVDVIQTDDQGGLTFQPGQAGLITKNLEALAATAAASQGTPVSTVSCGTTAVLVVTPGNEVSCAVTFTNGSPGVAKFKVTAVEGNPTLVDLGPA